MKVSTAVGLSILAWGAAWGADLDKPFQSHMADGTPYWVVICAQADECFEDAYKWCSGGYTPLDQKFNPYTGFRFVCKKPHKDPPKPEG
jgi:hypothetical protein